MNESQQSQINEARAKMAEAKADAAADEHAASAERVATPGFPIQLADGSEVMAVKKVANAHGATVVEDEDGNQYEPVANLVYAPVENESLADSILAGDSSEGDAE